MDEKAKAAILKFIEEMDRGTPESAQSTLRQLKLYLEGVRDVRLHDSCIILLDGCGF